MDPIFLQVVIVGLMLLLPFFLIYKKVGMHPAWCLMLFIPIFGVLMVFLHLAFWPWPNAQDGKEF